MVAYEMTTSEQSLLVVLNRGGANQLQTTYDEVIFEIRLFGNHSIRSSDSVTILAYSEDNGQQNQTDTGNGTGDTSGNSTTDNSNNTGDSSGNSTEKIKLNKKK